MVARNRTHPYGLALALVSAALILVGCMASGDEPIPEQEPAGPTMNHAKHLARNIECADCHDPDGTGEPKLPPGTLCWDCHDEDETTWAEPFRAYIEAVRQPDGGYVFPKLEYSSDLVMSHPAHAGKGVECAACHGEAAETAFSRPGLMEQKQSCMTCHEEQGASNACEVCHREIRADLAPPSHEDGFIERHGAQAPAGWRTGEGGLCAVCHEVPTGCDSCHQETLPPSHGQAGFREIHGRDVVEMPFSSTSCALCHDQDRCTACHQVTKPRSHNVPFERRVHGVVAAIERQSCRTCHQQDFCDRCHRTARPVSHTGPWGNGRQVHCVGCHDPLPTNGCFTCHKNTLGHSQATPLPPGPPHNAAQDCRTCHSVLPHLDDGGNCRRCHR